MKKILSLILCAFVLLSFAACKIQKEKEQTEKLNIVATIFPQYDFARTIAGDKAEVTMLLPPGADSHSFEPTVSDILLINSCDIFIYTGGESDSWIDTLLDCADNPDMKVISLMECVDIHNTHEEHNHNHNHSHIDEHVWTSPLNAVTISEKICDAIKEKDPENSDYYENQFETYKKDLELLHEDFKNIVDNAKHKTFIFADRFPLTHFAEEYGLNYYAAFSGCSEDTEPSAHTVANLIDKVREESLSSVLKIELSSGKIADTISKETGAEIYTFYSCHNISKDDFENGETYLSLMKKNTETLKIVLN